MKRNVRNENSEDTIIIVSGEARYEPHHSVVGSIGERKGRWAYVVRAVDSDYRVNRISVSNLHVDGGREILDSEMIRRTPTRVIVSPGGAPDRVSLFESLVTRIIELRRGQPCKVFRKIYVA